MSDSANIFRERLIAAMELRGIKQRPLAERAGLNQTTVRSLLKRNQIPRLDTLYKLSAFLKVPMSYLVGESDSIDPAGDQTRSILELMREYLFAIYGAMLIKRIADKADPTKFAEAIEEGLGFLIDAPEVNEETMRVAVGMTIRRLGVEKASVTGRAAQPRIGAG